MTPEELDNLLRPIPDWPKPGVTFRDIGPLLDDPKALMAAVAAMVAPWRETPIDVVAGAESRGFIFGTAIALALGVGFAPLRKPGKLPPPVSQVSYTLEYGEDQLEAAADAFTQRRVLLVDDVLATGHPSCRRCVGGATARGGGGRQYLAGNPHFGRPAVACPHADRKRPQLKMKEGNPNEAHKATIITIRRIPQPPTAPAPTTPHPNDAGARVQATPISDISNLLTIIYEPIA